LRDAIAGASFSDANARERVRDIRLLESLVASGQRNWASSVAFRDLRRKYPVEAVQIASELRDHRVVRRAEAERLVRQQVNEDARAEAQARALRKEREAAEEKAALGVWLALGGEP
jgi:hypothetical protein